MHAAAIHTWHIGICAIFVSGIFKLVCAFGSNWIRRVLSAGRPPRLAERRLRWCSSASCRCLEILHSPIVGFVSLAVVLTTLVARIELPCKMPGAVGSLLIGGVMYYALQCGRKFGHFAARTWHCRPKPLPINPARRPVADRVARGLRVRVAGGVSRVAALPADRDSVRAGHRRRRHRLHRKRRGSRRRIRHGPGRSASRPSPRSSPACAAA